MKDPLAYTYDGIEQQLNLLEIHFKEAPKDDEAFCNDCINKHIQTIRGFAIEGIGFAKTDEERKRFVEAEKQIKSLKGKNYQKHGYEFTKKVRQIRKSLSSCPSCSDSIKNISKDLNSKATFNNDTHSSFGPIKDYDQLNGENKNMAKYTELMYMNAGQFAAEGLKYLAETNATLIPHEKWVKIGGGLGLQMLGLFIKMPKALKEVSIVAGSNLLASGVIMMVRGGTNGVARAGVSLAGQGVGNAGAGKFTGRPNGRVFSGPVTATNIPSEYARSGIFIFSI